jgi:hypothetical protein
MPDLAKFSDSPLPDLLINETRAEYRPLAVDKFEEVKYV